MNTPIINPMWIWAIDALTELDFILGLISTSVIFMSALGLVVIILWFFMDSWNWDEDEFATFKKVINVIKNVMIWTALLLLVTAIIPSEKTMYTMMATNYVTEENINIAGETVTDTIDYIFEKVDMLLEDNE